jgi:hypothetical protein
MTEKYAWLINHPVDDYQPKSGRISTYFPAGLSLGLRHFLGISVRPPAPQSLWNDRFRAFTIQFIDGSFTLISCPNQRLSDRRSITCDLER